MRMFIDDNLKVWTLAEIADDYKSFIADGSIEPEIKFGEYLNSCMAENNGVLTELTEDEKRDVEVTYIYYTGNIQHTSAIRHIKVAEVLGEATNRNGVYIKGINGIIFNDDEKRIIQASGYNYERGLYCDLY